MRFSPLAPEMHGALHSALSTVSVKTTTLHPDSVLRCPNLGSHTFKPCEPHMGLKLNEERPYTYVVSQNFRVQSPSRSDEGMDSPYRHPR